MVRFSVLVNMWSQVITKTIIGEFFKNWIRFWFPSLSGISFNNTHIDWSWIQIFCICGWYSYYWRWFWRHQHVETILATTFSHQNLGKHQYYLGTEMLGPYKASIYLRGNMYTGLLSSRPIDTLIDLNMKLLTDRELFSDPSRYCWLFGKLN